MENARKTAARGGRVEIELAELERVGSIAVAEGSLAGDGNVTGHGFVGFVPAHAGGNIEIAEIVVPGLHGVGKNHGIPVETVDGKARVVDGGRDRAEADALDASFAAELQAVVLHADAAFHAAPKSIRTEVRQHHPVGFENVTGPAYEIGGVKVVKTQNDIIGYELPLPAEDTGGERALAAHVDTAQGYFGSAKHLADVQQIEPGAITIIPVRRFEVFCFSLQIHMRTPDINHSLFHREGVAVHRKFSREIRGHWHIAPASQLDRIPIDRS